MLASFNHSLADKLIHRLFFDYALRSKNFIEPFKYIMFRYSKTITVNILTPQTVSLASLPIPKQAMNPLLFDIVTATGHAGFCMIRLETSR